MKPWPYDPQGDLVPILSLSIEEAKMRHPSASGEAPGVILTVADRCDACGAAAVYRVCHKAGYEQVLDFCLHHWRKNFPPMVDQGWAVIGGNPDLLGGDKP